MEMKHVTLDTEKMTYQEVNELLQELRAIRTRKHELHERFSLLYTMVSNMKDEEMSYVSRYTGEIFNPNDWILYDERNHEFYDEEVKK